MMRGIAVKTNVPFVLNLFSFLKEETPVQVLNSYIDILIPVTTATSHGKSDIKLV